VRRKKSVAKYALTQARYLAIFMNFLQTVPAKTGNFQPDRIGSDVNRGKGRHGRRPVYSLASIVMEFPQACCRNFVKLRLPWLVQRPLLTASAQAPRVPRLLSERAEMREVRSVR